MYKGIKKMIIIILIFFINNPAYPMLIMKQEKRNSPPYLLLSKKKLERDPLLPRQQHREGFEFVIIAGQAVLQGAGAVVQTAGAAATLAAANVLTRVVTGKDLFRHQLDRDIRRSTLDYDEQADYKAQRKAEKAAFKEMEQRVINGEFVIPSAPPSKKIDTTPSIEIESIREVDYKNNPEDKAWLNDFARKICPSGGYTITMAGDIIPSYQDEDAPSFAAHVSPPNPNYNPKKNPKGNKNNKHDMKHHVDETVEKFYDAIGHKIGEHLLDEVLEEWKHEHGDYHTLKDEPEIKSIYEKTPNYSSGKRLEYWKKDYDAKHTKERTEPTKPFARQLIEENKITEPVIAQILPQETTLASGITPQVTETNSSRWDRDNYFSSTASSYGSSDRGSSTSSSFSFGSENDLTVCTLYKDQDDNPAKYYR